MNKASSVEKVKAGHRKIHTEIIINAPAKEVWKTVSNTKSYKKWAAFLVDIEGEIKDGNTVTAKFQLNPSKEKFNTIGHKISVVKGVEFFWAEKGPMGICDNHHFRVEEIDAKTSRFVQTDELTKGATWLLGGYLSKIYVKGYEAFNQSLKKEVEQGVKS